MRNPGFLLRAGEVPGREHFCKVFGDVGEALTPILPDDADQEQAMAKERFS